MPTELATTLLLTVAGASLVVLAAVRLAGRGLPAMPRGVALLCLATGVAVSAYGVVGPRSPSGSPEPLDLVAGQPPTLLPDEAEATGAVSGRVTLHTGEPLVDAPVVLTRFERTQEAERLQAVTGPDGTFRFANLRAAPTVAFILSTDYAGTTFRSGLLQPASRGDETVELVVAESTDDPSTIEYAVDSTVVVGDDRGLQVVQIVNVRNRTDRAYVGGIRLPLLPLATGLDLRRGLDSTRMLLDSGELVSMAPVLPGETEVVYDYTAPLPRSGLEVRRRITHPTGTYTLLASPNLRVHAPGLRDDGRVQVGEEESSRTYLRLSAHDLEPRDTVEATIERAGKPGPWRNVLVAVAAAGALGIVAYPLVRRRRRTAPGEPVEAQSAEQAGVDA